MSRRKQSNPKPLLKSECQETAEEMTVERDSKELSNSDLNEQADSAEMDTSEPYSTDLLQQRESSVSPKSSSSSGGTDADSIQLNRRSPDDVKPNIEPSITPPTNVPKLRLNTLLASDPALKPDAKDLKIQILHDEREAKNQQEENAARDEAVVATDESRPAAVEAIPPRMKVFMCLPCGIGFSSPSTLEAHQSYYCSHRKEDETPADGAAHSDKNSTGEPSAKVAKTGKQYACPQCSYSADKKVSLNRHMRMHQTSPAPSSNASNGDDSSSQQQIDRYCSECDIRFSNVKTYRAHKQHYCSSRRNDGQITPKLDTSIPKSSGSVSPQAAVGSRSKTPTPAAVAAAVVTPPQPFLALPTNPIIIIPYSLIRSASVIPGPLTAISSGLSNPDSTCFSLENGSLKPLATALNTTTATATTPATSQQQQVSLPDTSRPQSSSQQNSIEASLPALLTEKNSRSLNHSSSEGTPKGQRKDGPLRESAPLDLSLRKSPLQRSRPRSENSSALAHSSDDRLDIETMMEGKENLSIDSRSITPEQIVCAPSLPSSPSMSPSPKRRLISPRGGSSSTASISPVPNILDHLPLRSIFPTDLALKLSESNIIPPLMTKQNLELALKLTSAVAKQQQQQQQQETPKPPLATPLLNMPGGAPATSSGAAPQIYVKQGRSKCQECNIVFCKYENYLAHKQHYCSARNTEDAETKIATPPAAVNSTESASIAYHQLICAACGIKYTSLDNLRAHQKFYCPKGGGLAGGGVEPAAPVVVAKLDKCTKCKTPHDIGQPCPVPPNASVPTSSSQQGTYKCPVCDVISLNAADSRKHLETHGSVKAFRCSICRYKGNTLRGMRTHIRMHFDKKTSDFNEENYMSCILEDDGIEIPNLAVTSTATAAAAVAVEQQQLAQQTQQGHSPQQLFSCDICNYSSSYKGNVMRHMKLVHAVPISSPSISPEIGGEESETQSHNGDGPRTQNRLDECFTIKHEPIDPVIVKNNNITTNNAPSSHHIIIEPLIAHIKPEPIDERNDDNDTPSVAASIAISTSPLSGDDSNSLKIAASAATANQYCQTCDIKFQFMNTYLAHKQFYCKNTLANAVKRTENDSPSPVTVQASAILNKNKENLEALL